MNPDEQRFQQFIEQTKKNVELEYQLAAFDLMNEAEGIAMTAMALWWQQLEKRVKANREAAD